MEVVLYILAYLVLGLVTTAALSVAERARLLDDLDDIGRSVMGLVWPLTWVMGLFMLVAWPFLIVARHFGQR